MVLHYLHINGVLSPARLLFALWNACIVWALYSWRESDWFACKWFQQHQLFTSLIKLMYGTLTCWHHGRSLPFTSSSGQSEQRASRVQATVHWALIACYWREAQAVHGFTPRMLLLLLELSRRIALDPRGRFVLSRYSRCFIKSTRAWGMSFQEDTFVRTKTGQ